MWKKEITSCGIGSFVVAFLLWSNPAVVQAVDVKESTLSYKETSINITTYGDVQVTKIKPVVKIPEGRKKGRLNVSFEVRNTGTKPDRYYVFASGVYKEGISGGGNSAVPVKGFLKPGEKAKGKIRTDFRGKGLPSTINVEVYSFDDLGHEPDLLETMQQ